MPGEAAVASFKAPQLPLEALIAAKGHFEGLPRGTVTKLAFISAKGGNPPGIEQRVKAPVDELTEGAEDGLRALIGRFDLAATPYAAMRRAAFSGRYRFDDYAHLARVAEWSGGEGEEEGP